MSLNRVPNNSKHEVGKFFVLKCFLISNNRWSQAAIAGVLGEAIYAPYDITGKAISDLVPNKTTSYHIRRYYRK